MKSFLLVVFCLCISLHAEDPVSSYDEGEATFPAITVKAYATFLKENPDESNSYQLYHLPMEKQLFQISTAQEGESNEGYDYIPVEGEENALMCGLTDLDVRCYVEWFRKNNQNEGATSKSLDESSSPLMMFGFEEEKKTDPKQNEQNQRRETDYDLSQAVQHGNNGAGALAGGFMISKIV